MSSDQEAQEDELLALASIYDDNTFSVSEPEDTTEDALPLRGGRFSALLDLPDPFTVEFSQVTAKDRKPKGEEELGISHQIRFLPPITMYFQLPYNYPSEHPPKFTLACQWLTLAQLSGLCKKLDEIWEENHGDVVLFLWTSFLKDDILDFLNIRSSLNLCNVVARGQRRKHSSGNNREKSKSKFENHSNPSRPSMMSDPEAVLDEQGRNALEEGERSHDSASQTANEDPTRFDSRAIQDIASQELLLPTILEHDKTQREYVFQTTLFTCQVCFTEKLGELCMCFPSCNHTYCKECMKGYFEVQIDEGNVKGLTCPNDQCESQAHPSQVKELVGLELFARYDRLLLQSSLDTMSDIMYCPRKSCHCAVLVDSESSMGRCPECHFAFCIYCKLVYHGVSPCRLKADEVKKLRELYQASSERDKREMERRYGKRCIRQIVEDSFSEDWLREFSKKCPRCSTNIQKIDGCNKMTCTKCRSYFCWLCSASLPRNNPYAHFGDRNSECFNKLFLGMTIPEDGMDWEELEPEWIQ